MTIRRRLLTGCALAMLLSACAGTTDEGAAPDAPAAAAEDPTEDPVTGASTGDGGADADHESDATEADEDQDDATDDQGDGTDDHDDGTDDHDGESMDDHDDTGMAGDEDVDRVVEIEMADIAFSVEELEFTAGERVLFVFENVGSAPHEALIGDMHLQDEHKQEMMEGGGHHDDGHHGDLSMISLESGESGSLVHEFTEAGELWMGCHVPGHWDAGMRTRITVTG